MTTDRLTFIAEARARKAARLIHWCRINGATAEQIATSAAVRADATSGAAVKEPSLETWMQVVATLERLEADPPPVDPWAGLSS